MALIPIVNQAPPFAMPIDPDILTKYKFRCLDDNDTAEDKEATPAPQDADRLHK